MSEKFWATLLRNCRHVNVSIEFAKPNTCTTMILHPTKARPPYRDWPPIWFRRRAEDGFKIQGGVGGLSYTS